LTNRRVVAEPVVCVPAAGLSNSRRSVRSEGHLDAVGVLAGRQDLLRPPTVNPIAFEEASAVSAIACRIAAATAWATRPKAGSSLADRPSPARQARRADSADAAA
jgi:hypothetical protein